MFVLCALILFAIMTTYIPEVWASPLTFPAAAPISAGDITYRMQPGLIWGTEGYRQFDAESVGIYGLSHNIAFIFEEDLPQYEREIFQSPTAHDSIGFGPGDISILPRYTFWEKDGIGDTNRLSALGGLLIPVGLHSQTNRYGRVPPSLEPGTGAWGTKDGLIFTRQTLNAEVDGYGGFIHHGVSHGYQIGNEYFADDSLQRRIAPKLSATGIPKTETFLVLETNFIVSEENEEEDLTALPSATARSSRAGSHFAEDEDQDGLPPAPEVQMSPASPDLNLVGMMTPDLTTGGTLVQLDPGIRFVGLNWGFAALAEVPAYDDINGGGARRNMGILLVYRHVFFTKHHL